MFITTFEAYMEQNRFGMTSDVDTWIAAGVGLCDDNGKGISSISIQEKPKYKPLSKEEGRQLFAKIMSQQTCE